MDLMLETTWETEATLQLIPELAPWFAYANYLETEDYGL